MSEKAERRLAQAVARIAPQAAKAFDAGEYQAGLKKLAALRDPVDSFFDDVMVMVDDEQVRGNRLALLRHLQELFLRVADISLLQGGTQGG